LATDMTTKETKTDTSDHNKHDSVVLHLQR